MVRQVIKLIVISLVLSGCTSLPKCENPEYTDSQGTCTARWM